MTCKRWLSALVSMETINTDTRCILGRLWSCLSGQVSAYLLLFGFVFLAPGLPKNQGFNGPFGSVYVPIAVAITYSRLYIDLPNRWILAQSVSDLYYWYTQLAIVLAQSGTFTNFTSIHRQIQHQPRNALNNQHTKEHTSRHMKNRAP